jgi:hypothetical protein
MAAALVLVVGAALSAYLTLTAYAAWSLWRERRGQEVHAHSDGTVHSHHRGSRPHPHPTFSERYDARLTALCGPVPGGVSVDSANVEVPRQSEEPTRPS